MIYSQKINRPTEKAPESTFNVKAKETFTNELFGELTIFISGDDNLYFIADEVTDALGYIRSRDAVTQHCKGALKHRIGVQTGIKKDGTPAIQEVEKNIIPESDVYRLVMRSKLPSAERFQDWVTEDVLPSIRKRGMYATDNVLDNILNNPDFAINLLTKYKEEKELRKKEEMKRMYIEERMELLAHTERTFTATEIAKECGFSSAILLNKFLEKHKIQYKRNDVWLPYADYATKGYYDLKQQIIEGKKDPVYYAKFTQKGREFVINLVNEKASY